MLDMKLKSVRTVLKNDTNEIAICVDSTRPTGAFYTMISIYSPTVRRVIAGMIAGEGLFSSNNDFVGSFSQSDSINLVFVYRPESLLESREAMFAQTFAQRKLIAQNFLVACAELQICGSVGMLLLNQRNVNITVNAGIYFNYFLDFDKWNKGLGDVKFVEAAAKFAADILSREYYEKYGNIANYPNEIQVFCKKANYGGFRSMNGILTAIKLLPDNPVEPFTGVKKALGSIKKVIGFCKRHSAALFLTVLVIATTGYLAYEITTRVVTANTPTSYAGLNYIGEVYLGDRSE